VQGSVLPVRRHAFGYVGSPSGSAIRLILRRFGILAAERLSPEQAIPKKHKHNYPELLDISEYVGETYKPGYPSSKHICDVLRSYREPGGC
jgi:hypothetical protein